MISFVLSDKWVAEEYMKDMKFNTESMPMAHTISRNILQSLFFESMGFRQTQISKQQAETFEWILREPQLSEDQSLWASFPEANIR